MDEAREFLARYPDVQGIDVILTDCHGIGRGKIIRRHELESLYGHGRPMPTALFGQDVTGQDVEASGLILADGGADQRCWPLPGTLGLQPHVKRGQVLVSMFEADGTPFHAEPRPVLVRQIERARQAGFTPMGAFELEFYLVDPQPDARGRHHAARYPLTGRRPTGPNTLSVDELDELSPLFDAIYEGAATLGLTLESLISEYGAGQFEMTIRYRNLLQAADDLIIAKRLIRSCARRFGMEVTFMPKPFGDQSGSGMHLHLSLADLSGVNLFGDQPDGSLSPTMLHAIGGIRTTLADTMLILAPFLNSWRRFASAVYSPASDTWGVDNRTAALRIPGTPGKTRHFEQRVAGIDANPYFVAAVTLGGALQGIRDRTDPGPPVEGNSYHHGSVNSLPGSWLDAIQRFDASPFAKDILGEGLHRAFVAIKRAEYEKLALEVTAAEWDQYGFVV
ncbi:glutamine synthetase family protein [Ancylobacter sp.]|uniref:glutamine synthetase family protein n=1 Tax=Ancylobacter sp. TaxID=1872567 RepID=UPI003C7A45C9